MKMRRSFTSCIQADKESKEREKALQQQLRELTGHIQRLEPCVALLKAENESMRKNQKSQSRMEETILVMKNRNTDLTTSVRKLEDKIKHYKQEIIKKRDSIPPQYENNSEVEHLKRSFSRQRDKDVSTYAKSIQTKDKEMDSLRRKYHELRDQNSSKESKASQNVDESPEKDEFVHIIKKAAKERLQLELQLSRKRQDHQLVEDSSEYKSMPTESSDTRQRKQRVDSQYPDTRQRKQRVDSQYPENRQRMQRLDSEYTESRQRKSSQENEHTETKQQKQSLEKELSEMQQNKQDIEKDLSEMKQNKRGLENDLLEMKQQKQILEKDLSEIKQNKQGFAIELSQMQQNKQALEKELSQMQQNKQGLENDLSEMKRNKQGLEKDLFVMKQNKQGFEKELSQMQQNKQGLENDLSEIQQNKQSLEKDLLVMKQNKRGLEKELFQMEQNKQGSQRELSEIKEHKQRLEQELSSTSSENNQLKNTVNDLRGQVQDIAKITDECNSLKLNLTTAQNEKVAAEDEVKLLNRRVHSLENVVRDLQESMEHVSQLENFRKTAVQQLQQKQAQLDELQQKSSSKESDHMQTVSSLNKMIVELNEKVRLEEERRLELVKELKRLQKEAAEREQVVAELKNLKQEAPNNQAKMDRVQVENVDSVDFDLLAASLKFADEEEEDTEAVAEVSRKRTQRKSLNQNEQHEDESLLLAWARNGPIHVYVAKYNYNPFELSPNDNPEAELTLTAGDYVLVVGEIDEDGFYDGELIDGVQGLVPSNFIQKIEDDHLFEFHEALLHAGHKDYIDKAPNPTSITVPTYEIESSPVIYLDATDTRSNSEGVKRLLPFPLPLQHGSTSEERSAVSEPIHPPIALLASNDQGSTLTESSILEPLETTEIDGHKSPVDTDDEIEEAFRDFPNREEDAANESYSGSTYTELSDILEVEEDLIGSQDSRINELGTSLTNHISSSSQVANQLKNKTPETITHSTANNSANKLSPQNLNQYEEKLLTSAQLLPTTENVQKNSTDQEILEDNMEDIITPSKNNSTNLSLETRISKLFLNEQTDSQNPKDLSLLKQNQEENIIDYVPTVGVDEKYDDLKSIHKSSRSDPVENHQPEIHFNSSRDDLVDHKPQTKHGINQRPLSDSAIIEEHRKM